ncbi:asparagine synthase [Diplogelasinospora grovesii]|uniref:Asparagine synthase n=1 Tax=Diplogelasinospora grovesii TaxID=303347 RepID=A0AAN6N908_9PEZI|nr:asparagine synthase [Diplogelasinospora grovesii]
MCGIHAVLTSPKVSSSSHDLSTDLKSCLCNRGPDYLGQVQRRGPAPWSLTFTSTVLALRGDHVAQQPLGDLHIGSVLCWNGEAWRIDGHPVNGNDGEAIYGLLTKASATENNEAAILSVLRSIEGPFAFVYYDAPSQTVYYGRDRLGRRSLMINAQDEGTLTLCSIAESGDASWKEVEADGIYVLHLESSSALPPVKRHDWITEQDQADFEKTRTVVTNSPNYQVSGIGRFNMSLPAEDTVGLAPSSSSVAMLRQQLVESLRPRALNIPQPPHANANAACRTRVAVLFSGGLDCTVLARLTHDLLDPDQGIDLINVAFENPRVVAQLEKDSKGQPFDLYEACPDRITGRRSFAELQKVCPERAFRFLAVNVPYSETLAHRHQVISLMHPHNTEMDLSIGYALYFAARGQGCCYETSSSSPDSQTQIAYTTPARVLLSGLGADELFGGYGRHAVAFVRQGYAGLVDELKLDVSRLGKRNLGRDDRVMAHWGKEVRFPYLDERLVRWAIETPAWEKCDYEHAETSGVEPGKRVLRLLALELGMENVAKEKKRAIQFGARTAKMESGRVKGTTLIS